MSHPLHSGGSLTRHAHFPSRHVAPRHIDVWFPPGFGASTEAFPVLYMHDGQNLFDPNLAAYGADWGVDDTVVRLIDEGATRGVIVVAVWNTADRRIEYMPQRPLDLPSGQETRSRFLTEWGASPTSDAYLRFLVSEVKPFIDATYRTLPGPGATTVMGSSMGGLISLYALTRYPDVFGAAGCLSTHWPAGGELLVDYFGAVLPPPGRHRLYFDYGTAGIDADYEPYQQRMDAHLLRAGFGQGGDCLTRRFDGADHNEAAWRARLDIPLRFLLNLPALV